MASDAHLEAARMLVDAEVCRRGEFELMGRVIQAISGDPDVDFRVELLQLVTNLANAQTHVEGALAALIDPEALEQAREEHKQRVEDHRRAHPGDADPLEYSRRMLTRMANSTFRARVTREAASWARITLPDGQELVWETRSELLGPAIEAAFTQRLKDGVTLYISDVVSTKDGPGPAEKLVLPGGTIMEWKHNAPEQDAISAIGAEVEDHVQRFGGITLDSDYNLVEPDSGH